MNRKTFLKKLGIGIGVAMVAPKVLMAKDEMIYPRLKDGITIDTDLVPIKKMDAIEVLRVYKQTGNLIYDMRPYWENYQRTWFKLQSALDTLPR